jgi:hypothetical protein
VGDTWNFSDLNTANQDMVQAQTTLDTLGAEGWELVSTEKMLEKDVQGKTRVVVVYILKRQKRQDRQS